MSADLIAGSAADVLGDVIELVERTRKAREAREAAVKKVVEQLQQVAESLGYYVSVEDGGMTIAIPGGSFPPRVFVKEADDGVLIWRPTESALVRPDFIRPPIVYKRAIGEFVSAVTQRRTAEGHEVYGSAVDEVARVVVEQLKAQIAG